MDIRFWRISNNEKVLIKDVPRLIYSEVIKDFHEMIEA